MAETQLYNHPIHGGIIQRPDPTVYVQKSDITQNLDTETFPSHGGTFQPENIVPPPEGF